MADFRTIALILAMGILADFLYGIFFGQDEIVDSAPPDIVNVNDQQFNAKHTTHEYMDESLHEHTQNNYADEDDLFDKTVDSVNYQHKQGN